MSGRKKRKQSSIERTPKRHNVESQARESHIISPSTPPKRGTLAAKALERRAEGIRIGRERANIDNQDEGEGEQEGEDNIPDDNVRRRLEHDLEQERLRERHLERQRLMENPAVARQREQPAPMDIDDGNGEGEEEKEQREEEVIDGEEEEEDQGRGRRRGGGGGRRDRDKKRSKPRGSVILNRREEDGAVMTKNGKRKYSGWDLFQRLHVDLLEYSRLPFDARRKRMAVQWKALTKRMRDKYNSRAQNNPETAELGEMERFDINTYPATAIQIFGAPKIEDMQRRGQSKINIYVPSRIKKSVARLGQFNPIQFRRRDHVDDVAANEEREEEEKQEEEEEEVLPRQLRRSVRNIERENRKRASTRRIKN